MKTKYIIILCFLFLVVGFFIGRKSILLKAEIKYVKGDIEYRQIEVPMPHKTSVPTVPRYIYFNDTIKNVQVVDTAAIIADWIRERDYKPVLFDNQNGKLTLDMSVQYNELQTIKYEFIPITKEVIRNKEKVWQPFIGSSYNTLNEFTISGGTFYHDLGIEFQYISNFNQRSGYGIGFKYKF